MKYLPLKSNNLSIVLLCIVILQNTAVLDIFPQKNIFQGIDALTDLLTNTNTPKNENSPFIRNYSTGVGQIGLVFSGKFSSEFSFQIYSSGTSSKSERQQTTNMKMRTNSPFIVQATPRFNLINNASNFSSLHRFKELNNDQYQLSIDLGTWNFQNDDLPHNNPNKSLCLNLFWDDRHSNYDGNSYYGAVEMFTWWPNGIIGGYQSALHPVFGPGANVTLSLTNNDYYSSRREVTQTQDNFQFTGRMWYGVALVIGISQFRDQIVTNSLGDYPPGETNALKLVSIFDKTKVWQIWYLISNVTTKYVDYDMCKWLFNKIDSISGQEGLDNLIVGIFTHGITWGPNKLTSGILITSDTQLGVRPINAIDSIDLGVWLTALIDEDTVKLFLWLGNCHGEGFYTIHSLPQTVIWWYQGLSFSYEYPHNKVELWNLEKHMTWGRLSLQELYSIPTRSYYDAYEKRVKPFLGVQAYYTEWCKMMGYSDTIIHQKDNLDEPYYLIPSYSGWYSDTLWNNLQTDPYGRSDTNNQHFSTNITGTDEINMTISEDSQTLGTAYRFVGVWKEYYCTEKSLSVFSLVRAMSNYTGSSQYITNALIVVFSPEWLHTATERVYQVAGTADTGDQWHLTRFLVPEPGRYFLFFGYEDLGLENYRHEVHFQNTVIRNGSFNWHKGMYTTNMSRGEQYITSMIYNSNETTVQGLSGNGAGWTGIWAPIQVTTLNPYMHLNYSAWSSYIGTENVTNVWAIMYDAHWNLVENYSLIESSQQQEGPDERYQTWKNVTINSQYYFFLAYNGNWSTNWNHGFYVQILYCYGFKLWF